MSVLTGARVVMAGAVLDDGWVRVDGTRIAEVGSGRTEDEVLDLGGGWLVPGYIDIHTHGGGGHDVARSPEDMAASVDFHLGHGTTRTLVSLVTAPVGELVDQLGWIADLAERNGTDTAVGRVMGAHLEGPFLSEARCGAQNPDFLLDPDRDVLTTLIKAARGWLRVTTVAPELPGALDIIADLVAADVVAAVGHTDATYAQAAAGFAAGARLATHLFNGMRSLHHREPGPALAALDAGVACEVINDGEHVHPAILRLVAGRGEHALVLITDAMDAAGIGDGEYELGGQRVTVQDGAARLVRTGSLAGSTLTMDVAVRRAVIDGALSLPAAIAAASLNPARVLGIDGECGAIAPGLAADLLHLDDNLEVQRIMTNGHWLPAAG
jgi:N-acetylglucosamine-6-phosphate deacetylase